MKYSPEEIIQFVEEENIRFIRLSFCDVFGKRKNISIMPSELPRAFNGGIAIDASAIAGFGCEVNSDLFLHPDTDTIATLPWRPEHGQIVRMFCSISHPDGTPFKNDTRNILKNAVDYAASKGYHFGFGSEMEFYLFKLDENGEPTKIPYDNAGYMDVAPEDKCENVRREICLMLEQIGIQPESAHHEEGPGQNEIDFRYSDPLSVADNATAFRSIVKTIAQRNGLYADFSPKPLKDKPGSGFHINISVKAENGEDLMPKMMAGIIEKAAEMTIFLNPQDKSYQRLGQQKAPKYITWSNENRSQLIRVPAAFGEFKRAELRSPDPTANPYLAFALVIYAAMHGIENNSPLPEPTNLDLFNADYEVLSKIKTLPENKQVAARLAAESDFIKSHLPKTIIDEYCK